MRAFGAEETGTPLGTARPVASLALRMEFGKLVFGGQGRLPMRAFGAEETETPLGTARPVASFTLRIVSSILISPVRRADTSDQPRMPKGWYSTNAVCNVLGAGPARQTGI